MTSSWPSDDDEALLTARLAGGDKAALAALMRLHRPRLRQLALRMTGRNDEADDIVQDAFFAIWRHRERFQPDGPPFSAYLTRAVVNRSIDRVRRTRLRRLIGLDDTTEVEDDLPTAERTTLARSEIAAVAADLQTLPARQRAAILLSSTGERSVAGVAEIMGLSTGAVEQLLVRARRALRLAAASRMQTAGDKGSHHERD